MRIPLIALLSIIVINLLTDAYIYYQAKHCSIKYKWLKKAHVVFSAILYIALAIIAIAPKKEVDSNTLRILMWTLYAYLSTYVPKYTYLLVSSFSFLPRLKKSKKQYLLHYAGIILGISLFGIMWWGALVTPKQLTINEVTVHSPQLPKAFEGYRIVQFSDIHTGTYGNDTTIISNLVDRLNSLHPDLLIFTGDIVNRQTDELHPFIPVLKRLHATDGIYSILGNHDYGDYREWPTKEAKQQNMEELISIQRDTLHWKLLLNEHDFLHRGNDSIAIIGIENWGEPPFNTYGDLHKAYPSLHDANYKLLLSHNPKHWEFEVMDKANVDLTLSGHTHAMQTMISIGKHRFSPAKFRYNHWGGLYIAQKGQQIYVNIGIGEVGMPMRTGAIPEITIITLRR